MKYTRLYADSDGETHFEDVEVAFKEGQIRSGGPTIGLSAPQETSDCFFLEGSGASTSFRDYHTTPRKQWFVVLSGSVEFGASDGEVRQFEAGAAILLDDDAEAIALRRAITLDMEMRASANVEKARLTVIACDEALSCFFKSGTN